MTSLLAGTLDHGGRGRREVSKSHGSPSISGTHRNSPVVALTTLYPIFESPWCMVLKPNLKHALKIT